jgi:cellulose synthase (UDP-forming)
MTLPAAIYLPNGKTIFCSTTNFSSNGFGLLLPEGCNIPAGSTLSVGIFRGKEESIITAKVKKGGNELGLEIEKISQEDLIKLVNVTFSRADNWAKDWGNNRRVSPLASLKELMGHGVVSPKKLLNLRNLNKI